MANIRFVTIAASALGPSLGFISMVRKVGAPSSGQENMPPMRINGFLMMPKSYRPPEGNRRVKEMQIVKT